MPVFLTCSLTLCAYLMSVQALAASGSIHVSRSRLSWMLLPVVLMVFGIFFVCSRSLGSWDNVLLLLTLLVPAAAAVMTIRGIRRWRTEMSLRMTALFAASVLAVGYVTLFSRDGTSSTRVLFGLRNITRAIQTGSLLHLKHLVLNIILFVPFGFLLSSCCPGRSDRVIVVITYALLFSAAVEALQYLFAIGECDLEDVLGNVLGAWVGLGLFRLYRLVR